MSTKEQHPRLRVLLAPVMRLAYFDLFVDALRQADCEVWYTSWFPRRGILFGRKWDVVHLHMLDMIFLANRPFRAAMRFLYFQCVLVPVLRLRRIPIVWTCHELHQHEAKDRPLYRLIVRQVARAAAHIIVLNQPMFQRVTTELPLRAGTPVTVMPHGDLRPFYEKFLRRAEKPAVASPLFSFASIGFIRPNKGNDLIIKAFRRLTDPNVRLHMVGNCRNAEFGRELRQLADGDSRIALEFTDMDEESLVRNHQKAEVIVFGFRDCPTSGSVITALSLGKPVIAPRVGHINELVEPETGWTFPPEAAEAGLYEAMNRALGERDACEEMGVAARNRMARDGWDKIAQDLVAIYRS